MIDPARRDRIVSATAAAVRSRTGRDPVIEAGSLAAMRATLAAAGMRTPDRRGRRGRQRPRGSGRHGERRRAAGDRPGRDRQRPGREPRHPRHRPGPRRHPIRPAAPARSRSAPAGDPRAGRPARTDGPAERIFIVACGMGLDARIMAAAENEWKRRLRFGAYVGAAIRELRRLESSRFRIVADGDAMEIDGYLAMVANAGQLVPGRIGPRQPIDPSSGRLELIVLGGTDPLAALQGAARLMLGTGDLGGGVIRRSDQPGHHRGGPRAADRDRRRPSPGRQSRRRGAAGRGQRARAPVMGRRRARSAPWPPASLWA